MSHKSVTTFIVTIFNVSKANKPLFGNTTIEISHNGEKYAFNLGATILPQSCSFYSNTINSMDRITNNNNKKININISKYNCCVDIPLELYFKDSIVNEFVMHNTLRNRNNHKMKDLNHLIPPIITLSITSSIPLPFIIVDNYNKHNGHLMYNYLNNNVPSPIYELDLCSNTLQSVIFNLISQFIDNSHEIAPNLNNCKSALARNTWDKIKKYIKNKQHRHMTLIAVFHKINKINNSNDIQQRHNKYIISHSAYKLLYRLLHKVLDYANPIHDVATFYLVLCIGKISYYQHENHLNCLIDDLGYKQWMNTEGMYQLINYLMAQNQTVSDEMAFCRLSYVKMICSFLLIHQTENGHITDKLDKLYSKLSLIHEIIDKSKLIPMKRYLFEWLIKPISNILLKTNTKNNKNPKITAMLTNYTTTDNNQPFGYLYNNKSLDTSYHSLFSKYYQYINSIQSISNKTKTKTKKTAHKPPKVATITETQSAAEIEHKSDQSELYNNSEPILKHYISNYAVLPSPEINANHNEEFCFLEQICAHNPRDNNINSMLSSFETMNYLNSEEGEKENINMMKQRIFNKINDGIVLVIPGLPLLPGFVKLTNYRLLFIPFDKEFLKYQKYSHYFDIPFGSIHNIISNNLQPNHNHNILHQQLLSFSPLPCGAATIYKYTLEISTKDARNIKLLFANMKQSNFNKFLNELKLNAFTNDIEQCFAVKAGISTVKHTANDGWNLYDFFQEFTRQKVPISFNNRNADDNKWRISSVNKEYKYCETYPSYFIVPSSITDVELEEIKSFRSKARIPVLSYYHHSGGAVIMRSSQPMTGMGGLGGFVSTSWWSQNRCGADEKLLADALIKYIIDARPKMNAVVNQAAGGGYENIVDIYKGMRLIFGNIHNIHEVRKSFDSISKSIDVCIHRHNYCLHIPHIKHLYVGHKHNNNHNHKQANECKHEYEYDFGAISSNQPYNMDHDMPEDPNNIKVSASAGDLLKMGINSVKKHAKSVAKHAIKNGSTKMKKSRSWQSSPKTKEKGNLNSKEVQNELNGGGADEENIDKSDLYDSILREDNFLHSIVSSSWFSYLRSIIVLSICIVSMIDTECKSVLIHCSDGWDRTSQLSCIAQILLDPFYRTVRGLCVLIEKDWISFGHKFAERFGHLRDDMTNDQRSPVFIQFLDCLYQIINQCPNEFEYNNDLLCFIGYHTTSCLYGTFLTDCEKQRLIKYKLNKKTKSIWCKVLNDNTFKNKYFKPCKNVLYLDHRSINLKLWSYYTKMDPFPACGHSDMHEDDTEDVFIANNLNENDIISKEKDLKIKKLQNKINELEKIKLKYQQIMQCIDTKNGFLLQDQVPIIPDLDYVSSQKNNNNSQ